MFDQPNPTIHLHLQLPHWSTNPHSLSFTHLVYRILNLPTDLFRGHGPFDLSRHYVHTFWCAHRLLFPVIDRTHHGRLFHSSLFRRVAARQDDGRSIRGAHAIYHAATASECLGHVFTESRPLCSQIPRPRRGPPFVHFGAARTCKRLFPSSYRQSVSDSHISRII